jgi:hypothetical protein
MSFPNLNQTGEIQEENLGNTITNANLLLRVLLNRGFNATIGRVTNRYILIYMISSVEVARAYNIFVGMGFEATELDYKFNSIAGQFSLRKGAICLVVMPPPAPFLGSIGLSSSDIPLYGTWKKESEETIEAGGDAAQAALNTAEELARLPGTLAKTTGKTAEVVGQAGQTAVMAASEGFGIMTKVVIGSCVLLAVAVLVPKLIDGMATSYDRVAESSSRAKALKLSEKGEEAFF